MKKNLLVSFLILSAAALLTCNNLVTNPKKLLSFFPVYPYIVSASPADGATEILVTTQIEAVFDRDMDPSTITTDNFIVDDDTGASIDFATVNYDNATVTATFIPPGNLNTAATYTVIMSSDVMDVYGNRLKDDITWKFSTTAGTIPDPVFSLPAGTYIGTQMVTIDCAVLDATIMYTTDGSPPTLINGIAIAPGTSVAIAVNTLPLQAKAFKSPATPSGVTSANYFIQAVTPIASPPGGTFSSDQDVTLTTTTPGAVIHYTTDGSAPSFLKPVYSTPVPVYGNLTVMTIQAITVDPLGFLSDSLASSDLYSINYFIAGAPTFSPGAGTYTSAKTVIFSSATPGASFKYTTDGSIPTPIHGTVGSSVSVNDTMQIQAYAFKAGLADSTVSIANYLIAPTIHWISPTSHTRAFSVSLHLNGAFFKAGATVKLTRAGQGDIIAAINTITSSDIFCTVNLLGKLKARWNVVVTNVIDGGTYTLVNGFRIR